MAKVAILVIVVAFAGAVAKLRAQRPRRDATKDPTTPDSPPAPTRPKSQPPPPPKEALIPGPAAMGCPVCQAEYPPSAQFCSVDGAELFEAIAGATGPTHGMICPTCRRGFGNDSHFCPHDADELVPFGLYAANSAVGGLVPPIGSKICPECGGRYKTTLMFCRDDGSELVIVN